MTCCLAVAGCKKQAAAGASGGIPPVQVIAVEARRETVWETLSSPGTIAANEQVEIKAETDGIVQEINFAEGERVEKGRMLVKLDETKLAASVAEAEANLKMSQANYDRAQQLVHDKLISQQEFEQTASIFAVNRAGLDLKKRDLKDARVYAPFAGIVGARQISPGQVITRNTALTWLVDLDTVKAEVKVPERHLRQLKLGQLMEFTVAAFPGEKFRGEVYFISPQIDEGTRTALVKARIPNADAKLRGGMFAGLDLTLQMREIMLKHAKGRGQIGRIIGSVNPLVPKPSTTYQWLPMEDPDVIEQKVKRLRELTSDIDNVFFNIKSERHSFYQALLSLGDRRVAPAIEAAEANGGDWRKAVADAGVDADFYVFRDKSDDTVLPWSIIDGGMKEAFFRSELDKSLRAEWTLPPKRQAENARLLPVL